MPARGGLSSPQTELEFRFGDDSPGFCIVSAARLAGRMKHLIISRELPPATYPAGGIGTYVVNIAKLLAANGDTVHLIGTGSRRCSCTAFATAPMAGHEPRS